MKKINSIKWHGLLLVGLLFGAQLSASAGIFTWSAPTPVTTANTTLNQSGTVVGAEVFGPDEKIVALSSGATIDFKSDGSVASVTAGGNGTAYGAFTNTTGNAAFNATLTQFNYDGGPKTITLNNLVAGQQYAVQLFALDQRGGNSSASVGNFQDPNDASDISANFQMGSIVYVTGTFVAPASSVSIQENLLNSGNGNINALVVRAISANVPLAITYQPQPTNVYSGWTVNFTTAAIGTNPVTYQWQKSNVGGSVFTNLVNGGNISGATSNILNVASVTASDVADYQVVASNSYGSITSSPAATLTVLAGTPQFSWSAPAPITTADATLNQSGTIVGAAVFGATETLVTLTNGSVIDFKADGSTAAVTAGGFGTATGAFSGSTGNANFDSVLNQFTYDGGPDEITLNNLFAGQQYAVQLFALDDRGGAGSYRTANFQDPNDAYDISTTFAMGDNVYTIGTFTASSTSVTLQENLLQQNYGNANAVVIRALGLIVTPQITTQPSPVTIDQGLVATFSTAASGSTPLTYQWQRGVVGSGIFTNVPVSGRFSGATSSTLSISGLTTGDTADYRAVVANVGGSTNSASATLTVLATTPQFVWSLPAAISTADATLNQSGTIVGAAVFGSSPAIVVLTNGTSVDFKADGSVATATGAGTATGAYSGNTGNTVFNSVLNEFNYDNGPKTITLSNLVAGQQYAVQLFALDDRSGTGTRNANFQDPADNYDYSTTFFMPNNVYTLGTFTASGTSVNILENLFNGGGGNINALVVRRLSGGTIAPQITTEPQSVSVTPGATVQLTVGANGTALTYQWQKTSVGGSSFANVSNGGNISGATTAQLTFNNAAGIYTGDYRVIVSNGSGSVTSSPSATVTVRPSATLVHRWNFNETSGTIAHDSIGTADGTLQGSASFNNGMLLLSNPGSNPQTGTDNSYVTIPGGLVSGLTALTFESWLTNSGLNNGNPLIGFGGPITGTLGTNFIGFFLRMTGSQNALWIDTTNGNSGIVYLGTRQQNGYFHWVMTYDPVVGNANLYLNGSLLGSATGINVPLSSVGTAIGYIGYSVWDQSLTDTIYGPSGNNQNNPFYNGSIDEVRIYNDVLNTNAIAATQLLGANQLLSNNATLSISISGGIATLTWPIVNGGFIPESSPALGANAVWTAVSANKLVVGSNYQMAVPVGSATTFFRLRQ